MPVTVTSGFGGSPRRISGGRRRAFLRGVGSIIDLFPDPQRYWDIVGDETPEERIAQVWRNVGDHIRAAMREMDEEIAGRAK